MRLRAIRLENVRRFVAPVEIRDIGPGLNVLTAPNEHGKSTVVDALHALFFERHRSQARELRALQPRQGGTPSIAVEVEIDGRVHRIAKTWKFGRGEATVHRDGTLIHQADEAEAWIEGVMRRPRDGGPAGLVWVRQGAVGFDDEAQKGAALARRDLATSVAGEIEAMTGGRRMQAALDHCEGALARLVTQRGARAGGPLAEAEAAVEALTATREALAG
ncbi:MAG: AAA family ATPase, partial [Pseudomonadota bacterium]